MNGYPEWTPASEPPKSEGDYLITCDGVCNISTCRKWINGNGVDWLNGSGLFVYIDAWMPLPPTYEPPKFGWHNAKTNPPTQSGEYMVWWKPESPSRARRAFAEFRRGEWEMNADVLWWSHIEPTPEAHNET